MYVVTLPKTKKKPTKIFQAIDAGMEIGDEVREQYKDVFEVQEGYPLDHPIPLDRK